MVTIPLPEALAQRIEAIAQQEHRSIVDVMTSMVEKYQPEPPTEEQGPDWSMILGIGDENITDMSTTVRETLQKYFQEKYGRTD